MLNVSYLILRWFCLRQGSSIVLLLLIQPQLTHKSVSLCRARTSHSVEESIMFTAPSKVTSLNLTTLKALKSRRRSTRFDGCPRKTQHSSFCPQMVSKTIHSHLSDLPFWNLSTHITWIFFLSRREMTLRCVFCDWKCACHNSLFFFSFKDKTIKLWKISERDKRPEGYNLKEEDGRYRDFNTVTTLRVCADSSFSLSDVKCGVCSYFWCWLRISDWTFERI